MPTALHLATPPSPCHEGNVGQAPSRLRENHFSAQRNFESMHFWDKSRTSPQDAQKGDLLTLPTLARQDAPYPRQGRSELGTGSAEGGACPAAPLSARTMLADFFSILLDVKCTDVIQ